MIYANRKIIPRQSCLVLAQQTQLLKFFAYLGIFWPLVSLSQIPLKTVVYGKQKLTRGGLKNWLISKV
jgi:hypothetical protein